MAEGDVVRGLVRPCRRRLGAELHERWRSHLCGLCLTLRDNAGQTARLLTGYDLLLVPVLVEAQAGRQPTTVAGRCPLRGMQTADVVSATTPAMRLGAAAALLTGAAGLADKLADGDLPRAVTPAAALMARRFRSNGVDLAGQLGLDVRPVLEAPAAAAAVELSATASLDELLQPSGAAVAEVFAQTAIAAGVPGNTNVLRDVGDAYGRLVHLLDAVDDQDDDDRGGRFNPLTAMRTSRPEARRLALRLVERIRDGLDRITLVDGDLLLALLGPELDRAVRRSLPQVAGSPVALLAASFGVTAESRRKRRRRGACGRRGSDGSWWCCDCGDVGCCDCADCCDCAC